MNENIIEETIIADPAKTRAGMSVSCIICGEFVGLNDREAMSVLSGNRPAKVCYGCKNAVLFIKQQMMQAGM